MTDSDSQPLPFLSMIAQRDAAAAPGLRDQVRQLEANLRDVAAEREALAAQLATLRSTDPLGRYPACSRADLAVALANVSGVLCDTGAKVPGDPKQYGLALRAYIGLLKAELATPAAPVPVVPPEDPEPMWPMHEVAEALAMEGLSREYIEAALVNLLDVPGQRGYWSDVAAKVLAKADRGTPTRVAPPEDRPPTGWSQHEDIDGCDEWVGPHGALVYLMQCEGVDYLTVRPGADEDGTMDDTDVPMAVVRALIVNAPDLAPLGSGTPTRGAPLVIREVAKAVRVEPDEGCDEHDTDEPDCVKCCPQLQSEGPTRGAAPEPRPTRDESRDARRNDGAGKTNACQYCGQELGKPHPFTCCDACWPRFPMGAPPLYHRDGTPTGYAPSRPSAPAPERDEFGMPLDSLPDYQRALSVIANLQREVDRLREALERETDGGGPLAAALVDAFAQTLADSRYQYDGREAEWMRMLARELWEDGTPLRDYAMQQVGFVLRDRGAPAAAREPSEVVATGKCDHVSTVCEACRGSGPNTIAHLREALATAEARIENAESGLERTERLLQLAEFREKANEDEVAALREALTTVRRWITEVSPDALGRSVHAAFLQRVDVALATTPEVKP